MANQPDRSDLLDTIAYLARSDHRIEVLEALRAQPRTRAELRDSADASRVTVGRILADLEDRGWIASDGRGYSLTPLGRYVTTEFTRLVGNLSALESLPPVIEWFPGDEPTFELGRLEGATVVTATERDLIAPLRRALELIEGADRLRAAANGASTEFVEAMHAAVEAGSDQTLILPRETVQSLRSDDELGPAIATALEAGLTLLEADRALPIVQIADGTVALCSGDHEGMVETEDQAVLDWAERYFDRLCAEASPVTAGGFPSGTPTIGSEPVVD